VLREAEASTVAACTLAVLLLVACGAHEDSWVAKPAVDSDLRGESDGGTRDAARDATTRVPPTEEQVDEGPAPCPGGCTTFPADPIIDESATDASSAERGRFDDPDRFSPAGFCVMEPQLANGSTPGAMLPRNWLRPRFRWEGGPDGALYEVRLKSAFERHELRAYTRLRSWTVPKEIWREAGRTLRTVTVTIRALSREGALSGVRGTFQVAPVDASGSLVFWATTSAEVSPTSSKLHGFAVGEESVGQVLQAGDVRGEPVLHENGRDIRGEYGAKPGFAAGSVQCIGCHTSTPDGQAIIFTDDYPWSKVVVSIERGMVGSAPGYLTAGAQTLLKQPWLGTQTTSPAHFREGDRVVVASYAGRSEPFGPVMGRDQLAWFDLETKVAIPAEVPQNGAPGPSRDDLRNQRNQAITAARGSAWGILATMGEGESAVTPSFSRDGTRIVYVSTDRAPNGHPAYEASVADLKVVPYADRMGGVAMPLAGASSPDWLEYHPSFSPDDEFITFTRAPRRGASPDGPYYNRNGEIFVVASDGSAPPIRLAANDPVACAGEISPGVLNSWSKWSPRTLEHGGKTYYFLVFSSARKAPGNFDIPRSQYTPGTLDTRSSQLYLAAMVVDASGKVTSYPAVYLWNQNELRSGEQTTRVATSNLTPAWDDLTLPTDPLL
jgi:hypothetical protein